MEADVAVLKSQDVEFVSEITPCCAGPDSYSSIVAFLDPDGTIIELAEQGMVSQMSMFGDGKKTIFYHGLKTGFLHSYTNIMVL